MADLSGGQIEKIRHDLVEVKFYLETLLEIIKTESVSNDAKTLCEGAVGRIDGVIVVLTDK